MPKGFSLTEVTKDAIWKLRARGLSDREVGRRLGLPRGSVSNHLARTGGIRPRARRRPERCLSFEEREEISRAIARGHSARAIARALGRSHTTIAREIDRCAGGGATAPTPQSARPGGARGGRGRQSSSSAPSFAGW
jgi:IS30 family transposase